MSFDQPSYYTTEFDLAGQGMFAPLFEQSSKQFTGGKKTKGDRFKEGLDMDMSPREALAYASLDNDNDDLSMRELLEYGMDPERQKALLDLKLDFEAKRMAQAAPYNLMYNLPKTIMQSAAIPARLTLGGSTGIAQGLFNAIPSMRVNPATGNSGRSSFA